MRRHMMETPFSLREKLLLVLSMGGFREREIAEACNLEPIGVKALKQQLGRKLLERESGEYHGKV